MQVPFGDMPGAHGSDGQESDSESDDDGDSKEAHVPQLLFSLRYTKVVEPEKVRCSSVLFLSMPSLVHLNDEKRLCPILANRCSRDKLSP